MFKRFMSSKLETPLSPVELIRTPSMGLEYEVDLDTTDGAGLTILHYAVVKNDYLSIKKILERAPHLLDQADIMGNTPRQLIKRSFYDDVRNVLDTLETKESCDDVIDLDSTLVESLHSTPSMFPLRDVVVEGLADPVLVRASKRGDKIEICDGLKDPDEIPLIEQDEKGNTFLHHLVETENVDKIRESFQKQSFALHVKNHDGCSAAMLAYIKGLDVFSHPSQMPSKQDMVLLGLRVNEIIDAMNPVEKRRALTEARRYAKYAVPCGDGSIRFYYK